MLSSSRGCSDSGLVSLINWETLQSVLRIILWYHCTEAQLKEVEVNSQKITVSPNQKVGVGEGVVLGKLQKCNVDSENHVKSQVGWVVSRFDLVENNLI